MTYLYENLGKAMDDREGTVSGRRSTSQGGRSTVVTPGAGRPAYTPGGIFGGKLPKIPIAPKPSPKPLAPSAQARSKGVFGVFASNSKIAVPVTRAPVQMLTPAAVLTAPIVTPPPATQAPASGGYPSSGGGGGGSFSLPEVEPAAEFPEDSPAPNTEASTKPTGGMSTTTLVLIGLGLYLLTRSKS